MRALAAVLGERDACLRLGYPRPSFQRHNHRVLEPVPDVAEMPAREGPSRQIARYEARQLVKKERQQPLMRRRSSLALSETDRQVIVDVVHEPRFVDRSIPHIYAVSLDEGKYYGSMSTMYRVMRGAGEVGERRNQATHPAHVKPELCATGPGRVWCWDITKLHGPVKWTYYYLYVVIDIYSRYVVGWMVADRESSELAKILFAETIFKEGVDPTTLTIHADRGSSMKSKPLAFLLADLGVTKTHSRPHVSNDNPFIESHFRTLKYCPEFPSTFANLAEARLFCKAFFLWYNEVHRHSGIGLMTPATVHRGDATECIAKRQDVLSRAYATHPERFVRGKPRAPQLEPAVFINPPVAAEPIEKAA